MRDIRDTDAPVTDKMQCLPDTIKREIFWESVGIEAYKHNDGDEKEKQMREHFLYLAEYDTAELGRIVAEQMVDYHNNCFEFQPTKFFKEVG